MGTMTARSTSHPDDDLPQRVTELERVVGKDGSAIHGTDPTGLHYAIGKLTTAVNRQTAAYEAAAAAGGVATRLAWRGAEVLLTAGILAALAWLAGFHR